MPFTYVRSVCCQPDAQKQNQQGKGKAAPLVRVDCRFLLAGGWPAPLRHHRTGGGLVARFSPSNSNPRPATHTQSHHLDEDLLSTATYNEQKIVLCRRVVRVLAHSIC
jgi:hypothetical protein